MRIRRVALLCVLGLVCSPVAAHDPGLDKPLPSLGEYLCLGFEHILIGYDHLAFLVGLTWLTRSKRAVLWAVTAFTLAHSLSLALCVLGVVTPPTRWVETAIALSIAWVAIENWRGRNPEHRYGLSFAFGLIHGFGFAGALQEIGVPATRAPAALALFNVGVEAGQLTVLLVLWQALSWLRRRPEAWQLRATRVLNGALLALALLWASERALEPAAPQAAAVSGQPPVGGAQAPRHRSEQSPPVAFAAGGPVGDAPGAERLSEEGGPAVFAGSRPVGGALVSTRRSAEPATAAEVAQLAAAERVCELFARLPRERRAQCAGLPVGATVEKACARSLAAALGRGGVLIDSARFSRCDAEQRARYADCSFTAQASLSAADSCSTALQGQLSEGQACRSLLECRRGLQCDGAGPFDVGTCSKPKAAGAACARSFDPLAAYLPSAPTDHPECDGRCVNGRCR